MATCRFGHGACLRHCRRRLNRHIGSRHGCFCGDRVGGDRVGGDRVGGDRVGGDRVGGDSFGSVRGNRLAPRSGLQTAQRDRCLPEPLQVRQSPPAPLPGTAAPRASLARHRQPPQGPGHEAGNQSGQEFHRTRASLPSRWKWMARQLTSPRSTTLMSSSSHPGRSRPSHREVPESRWVSSRATVPSSVAST